RAGHQGQPYLQPARRASRDQRDRTPALHPARAYPGPCRRRSLLRAARETRFSRTAQTQGSRMSQSQDRAALLIEIGTEELPPKSLDALAEAFSRGVIDGLEKAAIT